MLKSEQVIKFLEDKGFNQYKDNYNHYSTISLQQTVRKLNNDNSEMEKFFINAKVYDETINGHHIKGVDLGKRFESKVLKGAWVNIEIYGLNYEDLIDNYDLYIDKLIENEISLGGEGQ